MQSSLPDLLVIVNSQRRTLTTLDLDAALRWRRPRHRACDVARSAMTSTSPTRSRDGGAVDQWLLDINGAAIH